jgi:protease IV
MRNFIQQTVASLLGSLLGLLIFCGAGTGLLILALAAAAARDSGGPEVKDRSVMVFDLSMNITDSEPTSGSLFQETLSGRSSNRITLRNVLDSIEKARRDKRIVGIYLDASKVGEVSAGFASMKEIRQALEKFKADGKKIFAYGVGWGKRGYYLSSVADTVVVNPLGAMEVNGFSSQPMFLAGAMQKYGVGVQVIRVGKFKGAVEPYVLTKLSPENREQTQKLLDDVWGEWKAAVGKSRKLDSQKLQAIADNQALLEPTQAKDNGLVDKIGYFDEVVADLKNLTKSNKDDKSFRQISLKEYAEVPGKSFGLEKSSKNKIAVVYAEGEIVDGGGEEGSIGGDRFAKVFNKIRQDKDVKAVVLRINSPGGSATAAEIMQREIRLTRDVKPVVVSMGDIAASGGYWIAANSNRIFAEPNTITGSIGVFGLLFNAQKLANDNGVTWDSVKTAKYADVETVSRPKSEQELALYQRSVNKIYDTFLDKVAQGRKIPSPKVAEIAQGRVWSGSAAKKIGLVDEIGGLDVAVEYAAKEAKLGGDWELQEYPQASSFEERFFGRIGEEIQAKVGIKQSGVDNTNPIQTEIQKLGDEINILQKMNDPKGVYARLPFNFKVE